MNCGFPVLGSMPYPTAVGTVTFLPSTNTSRCEWMWNASCSAESEFRPSEPSLRLREVPPFDHGGFPVCSDGRSLQLIGVFSANGAGLDFDDPRVSTTPSKTPRIASAAT